LHVATTKICSLADPVNSSFKTRENSEIVDSALIHPRHCEDVVLYTNDTLFGTSQKRDVHHLSPVHRSRPTLSKHVRSVELPTEVFYGN